MYYNFFNEILNLKKENGFIYFIISIYDLFDDIRRILLLKTSLSISRIPFTWILDIFSVVRI